MNLTAGTATGYGAQTLSGGFQAVIGSAFADSLTGSVASTLLSGGAGGNDTFDGGGGGTSAVAETIVGSLSGVNTLDLSADTVGGVSARLSTGIVDAGGAGGYGYLAVSHIQRLVGSAAGGDFLQGTAGTLYLGAGSSPLSFSHLQINSESFPAIWPRFS